MPNNCCPAPDWELADSALEVWAKNFRCSQAPSPGNSSSNAGVRTLYEDKDGVCRSVCHVNDRPLVVLCKLPKTGHLIWTELPIGRTAALTMWGLGGFKGKPTVK
jgi:hypothetical protein